MAFILKEIDTIEIIALMDNVSDPFTKSHDNMRWNELQYQFNVRNVRDFAVRIFVVPVPVYPYLFEFI